MDSAEAKKMLESRAERNRAAESLQESRWVIRKEVAARYGWGSPEETAASLLARNTLEEEGHDYKDECEKRYAYECLQLDPSVISRTIWSLKEANLVLKDSDIAFAIERLEKRAKDRERFSTSQLPASPSVAP